MLYFIIFLSLFFILYSLLHTYFYRKLIKAVSLKGFWKKALLFFLLLMIVSPVLLNVPAHYGNRLLITGIAYIAYLWMGALFLFFVVQLTIDILGHSIRVLSMISVPALHTFMPGHRARFLITWLLVMGITLYGIFEAANIKVEKISFDTTKPLPGGDRFRIVQISDVHLSTINGVRSADRIVKTIKEMEPHILVCTGDLIDRGLGDQEEIEALFRNLEPPYGKYAVTGNHEFYSGITEAAEFMKKSGFKLQRDEGHIIGGLVYLAGVDDTTGKQYGSNPSIEEPRILKRGPRGLLTILLKHRPRIHEKSIGAFDLQLSGHTHKGQIFPFNIITSLSFPYHSGLFKVGKHAHLYVSRGTGTWGPPLRFLSPPEITLIEFHHKS